MHYSVRIPTIKIKILKIIILIMFICIPVLGTKYYYPPYLKSAKSAYQDRDYKKCIEILEKNKNNINNKEKYLLGVCLKKNENYKKAIPVFKQLSDSTIILSLYSKLHLAECYYSINKFSEAEKIYNEIKSITKEDYFLKKAYYVLGKIYRKQQKYKEALENFEKLFDYYSKRYSYVEDVLLNKVVYPDLLLETGNINFQMKNFSQASEYYQLIINKYNNSDAAYDAAKQIRKIRNLKISDSFIYKLGELFFSKRKYHIALKYFKELLKSELKSKQKNKKYISQLRYYIGRSYYKIKDYPKALRQLNLIIRYYTIYNECPGALFYKGLINYYSDKDNVYIDYLNRIIKNYPKSRFSFISFKELLEYYSIHNKKLEINKTFLWMVRYYKTDNSKLKDSLWMYLTYLYKEKQYAESLLISKQLKPLLHKNSEKIKLNYWQGNILEKQNKIKMAKELYFENLKLDERESYYFWETVRKLKQDTGKEFKPIIFKKSKIIVGELIDNIKKMITTNRDNLYPLIDLLNVLGLYDEIFEVLEHHKLKEIDSYYKYMAMLANISNNNYHSILYARYAKNSNNSKYDLWNYLYPNGYTDIIAENIKEYNFDTCFVYAIMREESRYTEKAVSKAGALGLMQIMPSTGRHISRKLKIDKFKSKQLLNPKMNIKMGIYELNRLYQKFKKDYNNRTSQVFTCIGYNAGAHRVEQWKKKFLNNKNIEENVDYLVEMIPYNETYKYVRRVIKSYWVYKYLYGK